MVILLVLQEVRRALELSSFLVFFLLDSDRETPTTQERVSPSKISALLLATYLAMDFFFSFFKEDESKIRVSSGESDFFSGRALEHVSSLLLSKQDIFSSSPILDFSILDSIVL